MSAELFAAEFLSLKHIAALIDPGLGEEWPVTQQQLFSNLNSVYPCSLAKFQSTVRLLHAIDLLSIDDRGAITCASKLRTDASLEEVLGHSLLSGLRRNQLLAAFALVAQFSEKEQRLLVDGQALPWEYRGLRTLMIDIGIFGRESIYSRHWTVAAYAESALFEELRSKNNDFASKTFTPTQLSALLETQAAVGEEAERWVLEQERVRLSGHPLHDQIRWVSNTNVSAGFDIASFSSTSSLAHDYFIEVKSFKSSPVFYWSKVEVEVARRFGDSYALCLVDREQISDSSYKPMIIFDPFKRLFSEQQTHWDVSVDTYLISAKPGTDLIRSTNKG